MKKESYRYSMGYKRTNNKKRRLTRPSHVYADTNIPKNPKLYKQLESYNAVYEKNKLFVAEDYTNTMNKFRSLYTKHNTQIGGPMIRPVNMDAYYLS